MLYLNVFERFLDGYEEARDAMHRKELTCHLVNICMLTLNKNNSYILTSLSKG